MMLQDASRVDGDTAAAYWHRSSGQVLRALASSPDGLSSREAAARLERIGRNRLGPRRQTGTLVLLLRQFDSPIILILVVASLLALFLGDLIDAGIILAIVLLSGLLGFWRERGAAGAVEALRDLVRTEAEVRRDGRVLSIPLEEIVPGDVVVLNAGDLVPGDALILESKDLLVDEAALTGEAYPVEKERGVAAEQTPLARRANCLFTGTHVVSGTAEALVVHTGAGTELGRISNRLKAKPARTGFEEGLRRFGFMLMRATAVFLVVIFAVNLALSRPFVDSLLFSLALAVGLTPQLLPAIVSISLSEGARRMARERVIVKRLDAIEDFGSMDVLCTDKTGTITEGSARLGAAIDLQGTKSERVLRHARLNAGLQTGFQNPIDAALLEEASAETAAVVCLDEIPYDFRRKRLSVLVAEDGRSVLITKGAVASVLAASTSAELGNGGSIAIDRVRDGIEKRVEDLSAEGYRVLAVARRDLGSTTEVSIDDEQELTLIGLLTFLDPPETRHRGDVAAALGPRRLAAPDHRGQPPRGGTRRPGRRARAEAGSSRARRSRVSTTTSSTAWCSRPASSPRSSPSTRSGSSSRFAGPATSSASSGTGSTTHPPCTPRMSASPSSTAVDVAKESAASSCSTAASARSSWASGSVERRSRTP